MCLCVVQAVVEREKANVIKKNEALQQSKDNLDKVNTTPHSTHTKHAQSTHKANTGRASKACRHHPHGYMIRLVACLCGSR
jgi:hypothetical protein